LGVPRELLHVQLRVLNNRAAVLYINDLSRSRNDPHAPVMYLYMYVKHRLTVDLMYCTLTNGELEAQDV